MTITIPRRIRAALYIITSLGTPFAAYLNAKGYIGELEIVLWSAEVAVVSAIAALNLNPNK